MMDERKAIWSDIIAGCVRACVRAFIVTTIARFKLNDPTK